MTDPDRSVPVRLMARATLAVMCDLARDGCRICAAHVLPQAAVRVDRRPPKIRSWGYRELPRWASRGPVEHVAILRGVRVTWYGPANGSKVKSA